MSTRSPIHVFDDAPRPVETDPLLAAPPPVGLSAFTFQDGLEALRELGDEIASLDESEVEPFRLDVPRACAVALRAAEAIRGLRPELEGLPVRLDRIDRLERYAVAAYYAHVLAMPRPSAARGAYATAVSARARLREQAGALVAWGLLPEAEIAAVPMGMGMLDVSTGLVALALSFRRHAESIAGKTPVSQDDLARAEQLAQRLIAISGARLQPGGERDAPSEAQRRRARAFTLLRRVYEDCRKAVAFVRWDARDADQLVPSLFAHRTRRTIAKVLDAPAPVEHEPPSAATREADGAAGAATPEAAAPDVDGGPRSPAAPSAPGSTRPLTSARSSATLGGPRFSLRAGRAPGRGPRDPVTASRGRLRSRAACRPSPRSRAACRPSPESRAACRPSPQSRAACRPSPRSRAACRPERRMQRNAVRTRAQGVAQAARDLSSSARRPSVAKTLS